MLLIKALLVYNIAARRKLIDIIKSGAISVNDTIIKEPFTNINESDVIKYNGVKLTKNSEYIYYLLNKPSGYISSTADEKKRKTVLDLINKEDKLTRLYPIGRLDYDTTGIIIITNDGTLTKILSHPSSNVEKEYSVVLKGLVSKGIIKSLERGVTIDDYLVKPTISSISINKANNTTSVNIIVHDGKYHEVKRIFESINLIVLSLKRIRYDVLMLENLKLGEYRKLKIHEIKQLYRHKINIWYNKLWEQIWKNKKTS